MPLRQFNGYFSKYKNISSMKLSGISKILYIPLSKVCELWNSFSLVSPFRPVKAQSCRGSSGTNHSESYYIESGSRGLSGDKSRHKSSEHRLPCRQQSRLFQPAWILSAWLCSSGQHCSAGFQWTKWRWRKTLWYKMKWGHTKINGSLVFSSSGVSAVTAGVYFKILYCVGTDTF